MSLDTSVELAREIRTKLETIKEARSIVTQVGRPDDGTDINGPEIVEVLVRLIPPDFNPNSFPDLRSTDE